jgi:membrane-associated protease RseP (regulator of RpoE activity)
MIGGPADRLVAPLERVSPALASQLKLPKDQGRVVGDVKPGSTAAKAGLKQHDILLEINSKPVPAADGDFAKLLPDGKDVKVNVGVLREGKRMEIKNVPVSEYNPGVSSTIFPLGSPDLRSWEWGHLQPKPEPPVAPAAALPRGYEVISREPVLTTIFREQNRFTARLQEGTLAITVVGNVEGKKTTVEAIKVQEGPSAARHESMATVPVEYRDKAMRLLKIGEKSDR